jgi:hypothetical protein
MSGRRADLHPREGLRYLRRMVGEKRSKVLVEITNQ